MSWVGDDVKAIGRALGCVLALALAAGTVRADDTSSADGAAAAKDPTDSSGQIRIDDNQFDVGPDATPSPPAASAAGGAGTPAPTPVPPSSTVELRASTFLQGSTDFLRSDPAPGMPAETVHAVRFHVQAESIARLGTRAKLKLAGRWDVDYGVDVYGNERERRSEESLWDSHADLYLGPLDLRVGRQLVSWGSTELLSLNDVVNPRDYRRGFLERPEDLRVPVLAARATTHWGPLVVEGVWLPRAPGNRMTALETDFALLGPNAPTDADRRVGSLLSALEGVPEAERLLAPLLDRRDGLEAGADGEMFTSSEVGARAGLRLFSADVFLYGLWGHTRDPQIRVAPELLSAIAMIPPQELTPERLLGELQRVRDMGLAPFAVTHDRYLHTGASLATRLEPIGIKLDAAYSRGRLVPATPLGGGVLSAQYLDADQVSAALSLDYNRGSDLVLILEGSYTRTLRLPPELVVLQTAGAHVAFVAALAEWMPGQSRFGLRLLGYAQLEAQPSYAVRPAVVWRIGDHVRAELGASIYGGPATSLWGAQDGNDAVQLTLRATL